MVCDLWRNSIWRFAALAMNPLIDNAAQLSGDGERMSHLPLGFLGAKTRSGHSTTDMIESWLQMTGLIIVFPSSPLDTYIY